MYKYNSLGCFSHVFTHAELGHLKVKFLGVILRVFSLIFSLNLKVITVELVWQYMCVALIVKHNYFIGWLL